MANQQVTVRLAGTADQDALAPLLLEAYDQYRDVLSPKRWEAYRDSIEASVREDAADAKIVAELDGKLAGSVFLFKTSEAAYGSSSPGNATPVLRLLGVSKEARGQGIATRLIRESARVAASWGADALYLYTTDIMKSAVNLYERLGLERVLDKEFDSEGILIKCYRIPLAEFLAQAEEEVQLH
ncbi:GNAT family N-acetyltransferase [Paenibacillus sp. GCM10012307]|uniref:GNAT family N-acetyltransferase n=1 Tax=Paenibacillus roseus TaxID=2798579 RepID=A0A934J578_9BACL|nr:GNAT family N-acetyltransferase [Paenibacillus roseus]MBJ6360553.1 GNAT family N-acetyltransferase [Paenibacillus roseus]